MVFALDLFRWWLPWKGHLHWMEYGQVGVVRGRRWHIRLGIAGHEGALVMTVLVIVLGKVELLDLHRLRLGLRICGHLL